MDFIKVQMEFLKNARKTGRGFCGKWDERHTGITSDGYSAAVIPNDEFYLDIKKLVPLIGSTDFNFKPFAEESKGNNITLLEKTGNLKIKDKTLVELTDGKGDYTYIAEKLLKPFTEKAAKITLKGTENGKSPIYVFNMFDVVVGLVMPTKV